MKKMERLLNIIRKVPNFSTRPGFTAGRGATLSDLDSNRLEIIYQGILNEFGDEAAKNFVEMVKEIKVMSATTFLNELYALCNSNWIYVSKEKYQSGMTLDKIDGEYSVAQGMAAVASFFHCGVDETNLIKEPFLIKRGVLKLSRENSLRMFGYVKN